MDLADLDSLDFASWKNPWADLDDEAPDRDESLGKVLTLRKLLETVADYDRPVELAIETKHPTRYGGLVERRLVEHARATSAGTAPDGPVRVMSFSYTALQRVQRMAPDVPVVMLIEQGPPLADARADDRRGLDRRPRHQGAHASTRGSAGGWSSAGTTSTSGPSTPPTSSSSAWTSASKAVITDRPAYVLEQLDG